jgi:hypothetical protein
MKKMTKVKATMMTAGAGSGEGRMQKAAAAGKKGKVKP